MEPKDINNEVWEHLVLDKIDVKLNYLAANILLARLRLSLKKSHTPIELERAKTEIFSLYYKNKEQPNVKKDIQLLFNKKNSVTEAKVLSSLRISLCRK